MEQKPDKELQRDVAERVFGAATFSKYRIKLDSADFAIAVTIVGIAWAFVWGIVHIING